jgi:two-component system, NarL family, invasion response regulator UvrY
MTRVFLLEDHAMVREGLRAVLKSAGHTVVGESSSVIGLTEILLASAAEILILDIHLQGSSGLNALPEVQLSGPNVRSIVVSMSTQANHISEALRMGAMGYVLKGSPSAELLNAIDAVTQGKRYLGELVEQQINGRPYLGDAATTPLQDLSVRERQILVLVVRGKTSASIAASLTLSPKTVETYRSRLMTKLKINDLPSLVRFAIKWGLVDVNEPPSD